MTGTAQTNRQVVSTFDLFKIGIGPSSSHSTGPMVAAGRFLARLADGRRLDRVARVVVSLFGSLALTGRGHGTDTAVLLGLMGARPETLDPDGVAARVRKVTDDGRLTLGGGPEIAFDPAGDLLFRGDVFLDRHSIGLRFEAFDAAGRELNAATYFSIGGGFVLAEDEEGDGALTNMSVDDLPYPFDSAADLLALGGRHDKSFADLVWANECARRAPAEVTAGLERIWQVMQACIARGCAAEGVLPGGLEVRRRAVDLHRRLSGRPATVDAGPTAAMDWVNLYALAVNEENAAGGRVVTAPTNGAAGHDPGGAGLLRPHPPRRDGGRGARFSIDRLGDWPALQTQRLDLRRRGRLPGRGGRRLFDGRRRFGGGAWRQQRTGRERRRDWHGI